MGPIDVNPGQADHVCWELEAIIEGKSYTGRMKEKARTSRLEVYMKQMLYQKINKKWPDEALLMQMCIKCQLTKSGIDHFKISAEP